MPPGILHEGERFSTQTSQQIQLVTQICQNEPQKTAKFESDFCV